MAFPHRFFATCPKGMEGLLADELRVLGASDVRETRAGAAFSGDLVLAYRACLWSRCASRVLLPLARFAASDPEALYAGVQTIDWQEHLGADNTLAVDFTTSDSAITHSHFGALKVKDAVVDQLRQHLGARPSVDTTRPDVRINVYLQRDEATVSLDLSGDALHRRGYRVDTVAAPLKENLAAAILLRANWPAMAQAGEPLVDVMCGSGTLLIEAALMAGDIAPGILRPYFGFLRWRGHDAAVWASLLDEAKTRREVGVARLPAIRGYDMDQRAVRAARANIVHAQFPGCINVERRALTHCAPEAGPMGLVLTNPPYGERLGEAGELQMLYSELGEALKRCFRGWRAAVFTGNPELGKRMGLRARRMHTLFNGAIECKLLHFEVTPEWFVEDRAAASTGPNQPAVGTIEPAILTPGAQMLANRLHKNLKHLGRWAAREEICCYRLYDADIPEYNLAIDIYTSEQRTFAHAQEYEAPASIPAEQAERRLREALAAIPAVLGIPRERLFVKVRRRQKGHAQYEKIGESRAFHEIREGPARLLVNFSDYLDTGLFLDHRITRRLIGELARDRRFLNLFGYTGSATVHAALGGARSTTTVDMSRTYLDWARRHLALNALPETNHELIQADALKWLGENRDRRYDLIFLDPPTFSRSKRMDETFDVQRDHVRLITDAAALLAPDGVLIFSTNNRRFRLDREALTELELEDITRKTIPKDFERNPRIHQCYQITRP